MNASTRRVTHGETIHSRTCPLGSNTTGSPTIDVTALNLARTRCAVCAASASREFSRGTVSASFATARIEVNAFSLNGYRAVHVLPTEEEWEGSTGMWTSGS